MARSFLTPINLNKLELQNARIQNLATAPSSPVVGQIYYDTALNGLYIWNGTAWGSADGISAGALSSRPSASAVASGTFFYATDNFLLYYSNGTSWQQVNNFGSGLSTSLTIAGTGSDGTSTNFARADHTHAGPGFGSSTSVTTYGTAKSDGTATTVSHSDHTHGTPSLSTNAASNITATTATNGSGTAPAKDDHVHGFAPSGFALSAFGVPTSAVAFNAQKITGLADPTNAQDAATKAYVDATAQGLDVKQSVRAATTTSGTLATSFANGSVIDGVTLVTGDRILIKNQATGSENGIYTVNASGAPTRATDADTNAKVTAGMFTFVEEGTVNDNNGYVLTTNNAIVLGSTSLTFTQFSGAGTYTASNGVLLTGSNFTFNPLSTGGLQTASGGASVLLPSTSGLSTSSSGLTLNPTSTGGLTTSSSGAFIKLATNSGLVTDATGLYVGAGSGIVVSTGTVAIDTTVVVRKYAASIGDGTSVSYVVTHNLGTKDVQVTLYDNTTNAEYLADVTHTSTTTITVAFSTAPTTNQIRVVVFG